ncbi:MAG: hypothetical protein AAGD11_00065 [Planctomycetota bacterium]
MSLHAPEPKYMRNQIYIYSTLFLIVAQSPMSSHADESGGASQRRIAKTIAGSWVVLKEIQGTFDEISSRPNSQGGVVEKFQTKIVGMEEFWGIRQVQQVEKAIKELAAESQHEIVATGLFQASVVKKPLAGFGGLFLLTQKDGESFLSVLHIDGAKFVPWRIHHIPGKTREKDLLIVEFGEYVNSRQITVFQFDGELPKKP